MFSNSKPVHVYMSFLWKEKEKNNTVISLCNHDSYVAYYKSVKAVFVWNKGLYYYS